MVFYSLELSQLNAIAPHQDTSAVEGTEKIEIIFVFTFTCTCSRMFKMVFLGLRGGEMGSKVWRSS